MQIMHGLSILNHQKLGRVTHDEHRITYTVQFSVLRTYISAQCMAGGHDEILSMLKVPNGC